MLLRAVNWKNVENMPFKNEWMLEEVMKSVAILNLHKNNLFWGKSLWKNLFKNLLVVLSWLNVISNV